MRFSQGIKNMHNFAENALNSVFTAYFQGFPILPASPHAKKALYVNKANFLTLYSHKEPFYTPQGMWDTADGSHMFPHREFFMT